MAVRVDFLLESWYRRSFWKINSLSLEMFADYTLTGCRVMRILVLGVTTPALSSW